MPDISVVIVSFQVRDHLQSCLASLLRASANVQVECIVVDNASNDDSVKMVRQTYPEAKVIANTENLGFAKANNQGLKRASGRYWMLLNPDTEIPAQQPNALDTLVEFMDAHPRAGACGPGLFYPDGSRQHSAFRFPGLAQIYMDLFPVNWRLRESRWNGRYPFALYERGAPFQIDHPLGAALVVRPEAVAHVGLLDEDYFIYAEEVDWCLRLKRAGWEIWCVPAAHIVHHEAQSTRQFRANMFVELWKARFTLFQKNYSPRFNWAARLLVKWGMTREQARARAALARGELSEQASAARLAAFERVRAMARQK